MEDPVKQRIPARQTGLTIAEIPIALAVLALVLVAAMRTFSTAGNVQSGAQMSNQATAYAAAKLNELEAYPINRVTSGSDQVNSPTGVRFTRRWTVATPIASSQAKSVEVEVSWLVSGRAGKIHIATLLR
jgi:type II secretory pathway component PulJ